jgi:hypothetical protein
MSIWSRVRRFIYLLLGALVTALVIYLSGWLSGWPPERIGDWARWSWEHKTIRGQPTCDDPGWLREVNIEQAFPYYLPNRDSHPGEHSWDGDPTTAWLQNWPTPGDDLIAWRFQRPEDVRLVCVLSGWTSDINTYTTTGRLKRIKLTSPGCSDKILVLPNYVSPGGKVEAPAWNYFSIRFSCDTQRVNPHVTLWIRSVYPPSSEGESRQRNVAISEITFYF